MVQLTHYEFRGMLQDLCSEIKKQWPTLIVLSGGQYLTISTGSGQDRVSGTVGTRFGPGHYIPSVRIDFLPALKGEIGTIEGDVEKLNLVMAALQFAHRALDQVVIMPR